MYLNGLSSNVKRAVTFNCINVNQHNMKIVCLDLIQPFNQFHLSS